MDDLIAEAYRFWFHLKQGFREMLDETERQLHLVLEVLGAIILAMPIIGMTLWILGVHE